MYELVANAWKLQDFIHRCEFLASLWEWCSIALMALSPAVTSFTWGRSCSLTGSFDFSHFSPNSYLTFDFNILSHNFSS